MSMVRRKLNQAYVNGAIFISALVGLAAQSWAVFLVILALTLGAGVYCGDIRPGPRGRRSPPRSPRPGR